MTRATIGSSRQAKRTRLSGIVAAAMIFPSVKNPTPSRFPQSAPTNRPSLKAPIEGQTVMAGAVKGQIAAAGAIAGQTVGA